MAHWEQLTMPHFFTTDKIVECTRILFPEDPDERQQMMEPWATSTPPSPTRALGRMKNRKALGPDGIPAEAVEIAGEECKYLFLKLPNGLLCTQDFPQETEAIILEGPRSRNHMKFEILVASVKPTKKIKYLAVILDTRLYFEKSRQKMCALSKILPNIGGPCNTLHF
ncbi:hypothetical protein JTB14_015669 [Gonioctena quinquepunctata]|nr:hypothetical protein JTB14_015669 [Gonioctena quinquepunctata]